jgi:alpha-tubulin suppressor-like RCC1 family protein
MQPFALVSFESFIFLSASAQHLCYTVGSNALGQLGIGLLGQVYKKNSPVLVPDLSKKKIVKISCGHSHTCALTEDGKVYSWGSNINGQLGVDSGDQDVCSTPQLIPLHAKITQVSAGSSHSGFVSRDGDLYTCGSNAYGQLGILNQDISLPTKVENFQNVREVSCGVNHTLVLQMRGELYGMGYN